MAALISSVMDTKDRVPFYVQECTEMGIDVLPPDVNASERDFAVREGKIRFGLSAVKNVGDNAVRAIVQARYEGGPFHSIWDFCERVDWQHVTARVLESLVKAGALDSTGDPRKGMLGVLDQAVGLGRKAQADRNAGQTNLFEGLLGGGEDAPRTHSPVPAGELDRRELLAFERETLGLYLSSHPLADVRAKLRRRIDCELSGLAARRDGETVTVGGLIGAIRQLTTKRGEPMAFVQLEDQSGGCEVVVFSNAYPRRGPHSRSTGSWW